MALIATERAVLVGVFEERGAAEQAIDELKRAGFRDDQIGYVVRERVLLQTAQPQEEAGALSKLMNLKTGERATAGAITGGVIGGLLSVSASLLLPGLGAVFAGGVLTATLGGMALGAVSGGFLGALVGEGVPEEDARYYASKAEAGHTIVIVRTDEQRQEALQILQRHGAFGAPGHEPGAYAQATPLLQSARK